MQQCVPQRKFFSFCLIKEKNNNVSGANATKRRRKAHTSLCYKNSKPSQLITFFIPMSHSTCANRDIKVERLHFEREKFIWRRRCKLISLKCAAICKCVWEILLLLAFQTISVKQTLFPLAHTKTCKLNRKPQKFVLHCIYRFWVKLVTKLIARVFYIKFPVYSQNVSTTRYYTINHCWCENSEK